MPAASRARLLPLLLPCEWGACGHLRGGPPPAQSLSRPLLPSLAWGHTLLGDLARLPLCRPPIPQSSIFLLDTQLAFAWSLCLRSYVHLGRVLRRKECAYQENDHCCPTSCPRFQPRPSHQPMWACSLHHSLGRNLIWFSHFVRGTHLASVSRP